MVAQRDKERQPSSLNGGVYCYKVMPFGLKNAGATYQMATTILHDMIGKEVEVYVDDMMVKSSTREDHFKALKSIILD